jgi:diguanylate cyclase (GGDEF)-like protein
VIAKLRTILLEKVEERKWPVTFSIGVATFAKPGESVAQMVKVADDLMYSAKNEGKDRVTASYVGA